MKLAFVSHLNLKYISFVDAQTGLSSLLAVFIACGCYIYLIYISYHSFRFYKEVI